MIPIEKLRRLEILQGDVWVAADTGQLEPGDLFRLFETDGRPVSEGKHFTASDFSRTALVRQRLKRLEAAGKVRSGSGPYFVFMLSGWAV